MKKKKVLTRILAAILAVVCMISASSFGLVCSATYGFGFTKSDFSDSKAIDTFLDILESGITSGIKSGATAALTPLVNIISEEFLGLPPETTLKDVMNRLDEIDSKLDSIKKEVKEGFDKVISEVDKNEKMRNAIDSLANAEFLADLVMNYDSVENLPTSLEEIKKLSGEEQKRLVELNAEAVNEEVVEELIMALRLSKEYLTKGYIDSDYKNAFQVFYSYMKTKSMFCGEAANKSEAYWHVMKESYAKSSIALICALSQQQAIYELSKQTASEDIKQEAIDAAAKAVEGFSSLNIIDSRMEKISSDGKQVVSVYESFIEKVDKERTVFINKGNAYIPLKAELGTIDFVDCSSYDAFVRSEGFEKAGITKKIYEKAVEDSNIYYFDNGYAYVDLSTLSYENFINNSGRFNYYKIERDMYGSYDVKHEGNWCDYSGKVFKDVILTLKSYVYNNVNRTENSMIDTVVEHIVSNYSTKTIAGYLDEIGFDFGERSIAELDKLFIASGDMQGSNGALLELDCSGTTYDIAKLSKAGSSFRSCFNKSNPSGSLLYFENANKTIKVTLESDSMDGRIDFGRYIIEGKQIVEYENDKPVYAHYENVIELEGTKTMEFRLPANVDPSTVKVTLAYEGLCASSNHNNLCSYSFSGNYSEITLKLRGYTKIWLGYGVDAEIIRDGVVVETGEG